MALGLAGPSPSLDRRSADQPISRAVTATAARPVSGPRQPGTTCLYARAVLGDRVEILIDVGGATRSFEIAATRAGRRVEVSSGRGMVEVVEVTRTGQTVRSARFMAARVVAIVEHPAGDAESGADGAKRTARQPIQATERPPDLWTANPP